jgi:hypothetical protein
MAEFMFSNVAYRATVYRTGLYSLLECLTCKGEEAINCLSRSPALPLGVEFANLPSMDPVTDPGLLGGVAKLGLLG